MGKRLVKTAKQQFEERLRELTLIKEFQLTESDLYFLCENEHHEMSILRNIRDYEFHECKYDKSYRDLIESEEFLNEMTDRFKEGKLLIKPLFEWYASADKDNEPFTLFDTWMCDLELTDQTVIFTDLYEEVPDPRIITAKEQWEKDSQGAEVIQKLANGSTYKVAVTDASITFFVYQDGGEYFREIYPSFDELRKDAGFVTAYLSHVRSMHDADIDAALSWLQGGEYTMSKVSLLDIYEVGEDIDHLCYEDKEEQPIAKQDFKKEADALRKKMVAHIIELCEQGMKLNVEVLCMNPFLLWEDACYASTEGIEDCWIAKDDENRWRFYWKNKDGEHDDRLSYFTIDGLRNVIEALQ